MSTAPTLIVSNPNDPAVQPGPGDTVSDLAFCPTADLLAASSWDNQVRVWQIQNGNSMARASMSHDAPALSVCWSKDGSKLFSGGADKQVKMMDTTTGQSMGFPAHDAPVRHVKFIEVGGGSQALVTGSWDKTLKYWDLRQAGPIGTLALPERVYALDVAGTLLAVGTAERHILLVHLGAPLTIARQLVSPLKWQTRAIGCFPNGQGYAMSSIEGRVAVQYVDEKMAAAQNFAFRCHRENNTTAYTINALRFHPLHGTFATGGADGSFNFWDKDSRQRLKTVNQLGSPVTACDFSRVSPDLFAYALGYDWSKGYENFSVNMKQGIYCHAMKEEDIKPKPPAGATASSVGSGSAGSAASSYFRRR